MRKTDRYVVGAFMAAVVTISGCALPAQTPPKIPAGFGAIPDKVLRLAIPQTMEEVYHQGAMAFAREVAIQSGERLYVEVTVAKTEGRSLLMEGETDLALLSQETMGTLSPEMACVGLPFFYDGAEHIAMALNAAKVMEQLWDSTAEEGVYPLVAMSGELTLLASGQGDKLSVYDFYRSTVLLERSQPVLESALASLGSNVIIGQRGKSQLESLFSLREDERPLADLAEVTMDVLLDWTERERPLSVMWSMHRTEQVWLTGGKSFWDGLSSWEQAVLREAAAAMSGYVELALEVQRQDFAQQLELRGIQVRRLLRQDFGNVLYGTADWYDRPAYFDEELYQMIQSCA